MEVIIQPNPHRCGEIAARIVADLIWKKPDAVLGLATGQTPIGLYNELIRLHREEGLDFSRVRTFNLDEYVGLSPDHPASYHSFMSSRLFQHINIPSANIGIPNGHASDVPSHCEAYEKAIRDAGGIDVQVLGIGSDGHLGFNEPTSSLASRTRIKTLTPRTRDDNAPFFERADEVPHHVITMGIGTIMEARECLLLAYGPAKAQAVARMIEGPVTAMVPASALQLHPTTKIIIDEAAAQHLQHASYYRWVYDHKPAWQRIQDQ